MKTSLLVLPVAALLIGGCVQDPVRRTYAAPPTNYLEEPREPATKPDGEAGDDSEPFIIRSPFGKHRRMDLTGMAPGTKVQDPTTGGIFLVPASKDEEPEIVSEPPEDWQPEE